MLGVTDGCHAGLHLDLPLFSDCLTLSHSVLGNVLDFAWLILKLHQLIPFLLCFL